MTSLNPHAKSVQVGEKNDTEVQYICPFCAPKYKNLGACFLKHLKLVHSLSDDELRSSTNDLIKRALYGVATKEVIAKTFFNCVNCDKTYKTEKCLINHVKLLHQAGSSRESVNIVIGAS